MSDRKFFRSLFRESNPALTDGLKRSTGLLSLICLVAMVLGAIGVGFAMRAHLQQRVEVLAIMKSNRRPVR